MINSTPPPDRTPSVLLQAQTQAKRAVKEPAADSFSPQQQAALRANIESQPAVRDDMIARGRALMADASYPNKETLRTIAGQILKAEDLSKE